MRWGRAGFSRFAIAVSAALLASATASADPRIEQPTGPYST